MLIYLLNLSGRTIFLATFTFHRFLVLYIFELIKLFTSRLQGSGILLVIGISLLKRAPTLL